MVMVSIIRDKVTTTQDTFTIPKIMAMLLIHLKVGVRIKLQMRIYFCYFVAFSD